MPRYRRADRRARKILIPNLSPEFSEIMLVALERTGARAEILPLAGEEALRLGKDFVHNDICFPAQINVGELLHALRSGRADPETSAAGLSKNCRACRAVQYPALARRALDQAGYAAVPIITSGSDPLGWHPGFRAGLRFRLISLQGMAYMDAINDMRQKVLPYELEAGQTALTHARFVREGAQALRGGFSTVRRTLRRAVAAFNEIRIARDPRRPVVAVVGEILVNYHPSANHGLVPYLLANGMEPYLPPMLDFFHMDVQIQRGEAERGFLRRRWVGHVGAAVSEAFYRHYLGGVERIMAEFRLYEPRPSIAELHKAGGEIISTAFPSGEAWLLPGEIVTLARRGVRAFVVVQPFGCLPNHITGRGVFRALKERYPEIMLLSLDYDPDVSPANIENRLQMLIMSVRQAAAPSP